MSDSLTRSFDRADAARVAAPPLVTVRVRAGRMRRRTRAVTTTTAALAVAVTVTAVPLLLAAPDTAAPPAAPAAAPTTTLEPPPVPTVQGRSSDGYLLLDDLGEPGRWRRGGETVINRQALLAGLAFCTPCRPAAEAARNTPTTTAQARQARSCRRSCRWGRWGLRNRGGQDDDRDCPDGEPRPVLAPRTGRSRLRHAPQRRGRPAGPRTTRHGDDGRARRRECRHRRGCVRAKGRWHNGPCAGPGAGQVGYRRRPHRGRTYCRSPADHPRSERRGPRRRTGLPLR